MNKHKKRWVLSLGGSVIVPRAIDSAFLHNLRILLLKHIKDYQFVIVCGGGAIAREYIEALRKEGKSEAEQTAAGIRATRGNALFVMQWFGQHANRSLPKTMKAVKADLTKKDIVICGALRYRPHTTSDTTAALLAKELNAPFLNITNVSGLYTADPHTNHAARLIPFISWEAFEKKARAHRYKPGQHFVLDQQAATIIRKHKIPTFLVAGSNLSNIETTLQGKLKKGTEIGEEQ